MQHHLVTDFFFQTSKIKLTQFLFNFFTEIFVGGNFTSVTNTNSTTTAKPLTYVARYNIKSSTWNPLNGV